MLCRLFIYFFFNLGGYDNNSVEINKPVDKYYNNDILNILTLIDLFGFLLLSISYIKKKKKLKKVIMIASLTIIGIMSIVCVLVPFIIESLQYNTVFMDWFNKDAVNNGIWLSRTVENGLHILLSVH